MATLTKSKVDTFMFLTYSFAQPQDWRGAMGLSLESIVPTGQRMSGNLLVILHERGGGQFLGDTGRPLSLGGSQPWFIAFNQFAPAGWVQGNDNHLDLDQITAMSIGWGGYFGTEGEKVEFTLMPPELVSE